MPRDHHGYSPIELLEFHLMGARFPKTCLALERDFVYVRYRRAKGYIKK
jgi:hypothetical protein